jgi:hypothetical protein
MVTRATPIGIGRSNRSSSYRRRNPSLGDRVGNAYDGTVGFFKNILTSEQSKKTAANRSVWQQISNKFNFWNILPILGIAYTGVMGFKDLVTCIYARTMQVIKAKNEPLSASLGTKSVAHLMAGALGAGASALVLSALMTMSFLPASIATLVILASYYVFRNLLGVNSPHTDQVPLTLDSDTNTNEASSSSPNSSKNTNNEEDANANKTSPQNTPPYTPPPPEAATPPPINGLTSTQPPPGTTNPPTNGLPSQNGYLRGATPYTAMQTPAGAANNIVPFQTNAAGQPICYFINNRNS